MPYDEKQASEGSFQSCACWCEQYWELASRASCVIQTRLKAAARSNNTQQCEQKTKLACEANLRKLGHDWQVLHALHLSSAARLCLPPPPGIATCEAACWSVGFAVFNVPFKLD
jgi:hypothetical protein